MKNVPAERIGTEAFKLQNEFKDVKISHLTTENGQISALMTCRVKLRLFPT